MKRRKFLGAAALAGAGVATAGCDMPRDNEAPAVHTTERFEWNLVTAWPPHFPILGTSVEDMAAWIKKVSNERLIIQVYGGGELVPAFESFEAVSQGVAELCHSAPYYWAGKIPATQFFSTIPFGMNAGQMGAWLYYGGGLEIWKEVYGQYNAEPMPCGNSGGQMGGWFNTEINKPSDFSGLKMRVPGIGGRVVSKMGASTILSPVSETYTNLERGIIDALEWIGPYHDYLMGYQRIAKYYYYPGWQEPSTTFELIVNKDALAKLPPGLQELLRGGARGVQSKMFAEFLVRNNEYFLKLQEEGEVAVKKFPDEVLAELRKKSLEAVQDVISDDAPSRKAYDSYLSFQKSISVWATHTERNYIPGNA